MPPSPVSSTNSRAFGLIKSCAARSFRCPVTPNLLTGNTDTRHYWDIVPSKDLYRFSPCQMDLEDVQMFHGVNEKISLRNLVALKAFYARLLEEADGR